MRQEQIQQVTPAWATDRGQTQRGGESFAASQKHFATIE